MNIKSYFNRISYHGTAEVTEDVLFNLHRQHVYHVPFENLDVYFKRKFDLRLENIYRKVVDNNRGGFCYELNLLFHWLLQRKHPSNYVNEKCLVGRRSSMLLTFLFGSSSST